MAILWGVLGFIFGSASLALVRAAQWEKVDKKIDKALSRLDVNVPRFFDTYQKLNRLNEEIIQTKLVLENRFEMINDQRRKVVELRKDLEHYQDMAGHLQTLIDAWKCRRGWINAGGLVCSQCLDGPKVPMAKV